MTDASRGEPKMTAGIDLGDRYSYLWQVAHHPTNLRAALLLGAAPARRHRGGHPLAVGEPSARRMWPRSVGRQRPQDKAHLRRGTKDR